jgi:hypothetical protein
MTRLPTTPALAPDDLDGEARDDLVTLERGASGRRRWGRGRRLLWIGVAGAALLGIASSVLLMGDAGELREQSSQADGASASLNVEATAPPSLARAERVRIADADASAALPELQLAAVTAAVDVADPDSIDTTSALKREENELANSLLHPATGVPISRPSELARNSEVQAAETSRLADRAPILPDPTNRPTFPLQGLAPSVSGEGREVKVHSAPSARAMTPAEIRTFLERANDRLRDGDIGGARRLLEYASSGENGEALLLLASTYDPAALAGWGARSVKPDLKMARALYERAVELGTTGAGERLAALPPSN